MNSAVLWNALPSPAVLIDAQNRIELLNPAAETFLNASAKHLIGTPVWDVVMVDAPLEGAVARVRRGYGAVFVTDVDVGSGTRAPVQCNLQIALMTEEPEQILLVITPREIAGRLGRHLNTKTSAKSAIGMAEMLAHEIKNPLAGITGAAQLLSMSLSGEDIELTDLIVAESRRIVKLLDQVEQFGNLRPPNCKPVNIHDILERARRSALLGFASHMQMRESYDPSLPLTFADADQLQQVFLNLIKNAAEAGKPGGTIHIRTFYDMALRVHSSSGPDRRLPLQVEICDDGPGLPDDIASDIFEPFVSGKENGTGLGLALVSKIIADHQGWISVESTPGRTVFRISLPVAPQIEESS